MNILHKLAHILGINSGTIVTKSDSGRWCEVNIKKYLGVLDFQEGTERPSFYLPVLSPANKFAYELWPAPLAVIVTLWQIISGCFALIYRDLLDLSKQIRVLKSKKGDPS